MNHLDKLRARIGREAVDAQTMRDFEAELRAKGQHSPANKIKKKAEEHEAEARFLRGRLRKYQ